VPRNWALVRALVADEVTPVAHIFIAAPLRRRLLDYAESIGERAALVAMAAEVLVQPGDSQPHNDHMHVRIAPPPGAEPILARTYARVEKAAKVTERPHQTTTKKLVRHHHQKAKAAKAEKKVKAAKKPGKSRRAAAPKNA
jgi:penicillin-insensitive murein endopeptidase